MIRSEIEYIQVIQVLQQNGYNNATRMSLPVPILLESPKINPTAK